MSSKKSIRAEKTPPKTTKDIQQMVDTRGFPLTTEQGSPLVSEKDTYRRSEYGADTAVSVVLDSDSYKNEARSTKNVFSKASPAALPVIEQFPVTSEVARSLLGIDRETTQQGLFGNVSSYGLDPKDWKVEDTGFQDDPSTYWWTRRPSSTGRYYSSIFIEDDKNSSIVISSNPTPFLAPSRPLFFRSLLDEGSIAENYGEWGQYINSLVALYLIKYMVKNFTRSQWEDYDLLPMLSKYPPIENEDGTLSFNELYWDKLWLDIQQNRFGSSSASTYPILPSGKAYNFNDVEITNWRSNPSLWGEENVFIREIDNFLPVNLRVSWDSFFFSATRVFYPEGLEENRGHYLIKSNPKSDVWDGYFGLRYSQIRQDLKNWQFTIHKDESTVTNVEKQLKLPYFILDNPLVPDRLNNIFSNQWPTASISSAVNLPTVGNRIGGPQGVRSEITLTSKRAFRYQPGRISGFTYGAKVSEIGAGPGTILEFGIENNTDAYMFRLTNGSLFSIVRRSTIPLENTPFLQGSGYAENTNQVVRNGVVQYETVVEQKFMNGDSLSGEGQTGYILNPDTVTMYKIEFGWYGAIGARFYAYVPVGNNDCRWVTMHTFVIENQLSKPCLADPFFYFKYRLSIQDSSAIRVDQFVHKFGSSYYIDGYDEGTLYTTNAQSKVRNLPNPKFSETKTRLNAIDWTTVLGIKPQQVVINRFGKRFANKKEVFPESLFVYSQQDCEVKIIKQSACPGWAYSHQEGYRWSVLPESRRLKAKFSVDPYLRTDFPELGISLQDPTSYTSVISYSNPSLGSYRSPLDPANWEVVKNQSLRLIGNYFYSLYADHVNKYLPESGDTLSIKLFRDNSEVFLLSSRNPVPDQNNVALPYKYPLIGTFSDGYDIEFDYFRRDHILLSQIDLVSEESFLYWVGGDLNGIGPNRSSIRFGIVWPDRDGREVVELPDFISFPSATNADQGKVYRDLSTNKSYVTTGSEWKSILFARQSDKDWGIEKNASYDGLTFSDGLPFDFVSEYPENTLYIETSTRNIVDRYFRETGETSPYGDFSLGENSSLSDSFNVPGTDGGPCRGLIFRSAKDARENMTIISDVVQGVTKYYIVDTENPWPNLGDENFTVTLVQNETVVNVNTVDGGGEARLVDDVTQYLLSISEIPPEINQLETFRVVYSSIFIASIDKNSNPRGIYVSKIAPGDLPSAKIFIQARQNASLGGVWVGQRTPEGIDIKPFTPNKCTVSISDGVPEFHSGEGPQKSITTFTHIDNLGRSTAPTDSLDPLVTYKSTNESPKKCGSFLSKGGVNSAAIFTASDYPLRWLTSRTGDSIATYYVSANTPTRIDLGDIYGVTAESIVNDGDSNTATFFIARALKNPDPGEEDSNEIYMSLNYNEQ